MKPFGTAVAVAVVLGWAAAVSAAEPVITLAPLPPDQPLPASVAAPACGCAAGAPCMSCGRCGCLGNGRLWTWLTYRPLHRVQCGECRSCCEGRWTPLYLYFVGSCKEHPCTGCGACGNTGCATCGGGRPPVGSVTGWGATPNMIGD